MSSEKDYSFGREYEKELLEKLRKKYDCVELLDHYCPADIIIKLPDHDIYIESKRLRTPFDYYPKVRFKDSKYKFAMKHIMKGDKYWFNVCAIDRNGIIDIEKATFKGTMEYEDRLTDGSKKVCLFHLIDYKYFKTFVI